MGLTEPPINQVPHGLVEAFGTDNVTFEQYNSGNWRVTVEDGWHGFVPTVDGFDHTRTYVKTHGGVELRYVYED